MFEMLSKYYKINELYLTNNFEEKCKKNYKELYFGATKYCIKNNNYSASNYVEKKENIVNFK